MEDSIITSIARSLYFSDADIMFGWQGWAYKQATKWKRLHDSWATILDDEKNVWLEKAKIILADIKENDNDLYQAIINGHLDVKGNRWWI
jgi:hypothetical protein